MRLFVGPKPFEHFDAGQPGWNKWTRGGKKFRRDSKLYLTRAVRNITERNMCVLSLNGSSVDRIMGLGQLVYRCTEGQWSAVHRGTVLFVKRLRAGL